MTAAKHATSTVTPKLRFPQFRKAKGWRKTALNSVLVEHNLKSDGKSEVHSVSLSKGVIPQIEHLGRSFAAADTSHYSLVRPFDVIYTKSPLALYKLGIVKQHRRSRNAIVSPLYGVFSPVNRYIGEIIASYFDSPSRTLQFLDPLAQKGAKNTIQISNDRFLSGEIYLPADRAEQQKIADCLTSLDELIAAQGRKVEALKAHKRGLMQQLFPREGETVPRFRFPEFRDGPEWEERKLSESAKRGSGHTPSKSKEEYYNGGIKWVSLADSKRFDNGYVSETTIEISDEGISHSSAVLHPAGSVLLCRDAGIGKVAILKEPMAVSQHFMVWTCNETLLSNWFLYYSFQMMRPLFESVASGSTIKTIGLPFFAGLSVIAPLIAEQHRIADCLSSLDVQIAAESNQLASLKTHKQGLMQQLFPSPDAD